MCGRDIIRREVRGVGVGSEQQAVLLVTTTSTCVVPQSVVFVLLLRMGTRRCPSHHTHQSSCCPAHFPSNQLSLSPPLSESGRHPLSRCGGVQTIGLTWMSMLIERIQGRETLQRTSATTPLCVCCCWCMVHQALSTPPPHTIGHHKGVSPQTS